MKHSITIKRIPNGWAVLDSRLDFGWIPLPLTPECDEAHAVAFVEALPMSAGLTVERI